MVQSDSCRPQSVSGDLGLNGAANKGRADLHGSSVGNSHKSLRGGTGCRKFDTVCYPIDITILTGLVLHFLACSRHVRRFLGFADMCRLAAYIGAEIPLENIIARPRHSLLVQSQDAQEAKLRVNGDGFGIAWYGHLPEPGLFKDVLPAWADTNLPSICRLVRSGLFLAHVRAATTGASSRENCHPFTHGRWAFMHNGGIGNFGHLRRDMEAVIADDYYALRRGTTDSELFFLMMLSNGLDEDAPTALRTTLAQLMAIAGRRGTAGQPIRLTCAFSDGARIFAFRFADDGQAPTLYLSDCLDHGGRAFASEPLEGRCARWRAVEPDLLYELGPERLAVHAIDQVQAARSAACPLRSISS